MLGPEQTERVGTPLFFRPPEQRPTASRGGARLHSQQILVAGMLRPAHLLDLMRNFTVFQQVDGKTRKVVARYQQFRAIHKAVVRLLEGRSRTQNIKRDERGGVIWHTQGSGKSLSMVFLVRKIGFWKNSAMQELLTRALVRDLDRSGVCPAGKERDLAQRLAALAKENHEALTRL